MVKVDSNEPRQIEHQPAADSDDAASPPPGAESLSSARLPRPRYANLGLCLSGALLVATNLLLLSGHRIAFVGAAMGWWLIMIHPTYLICTTRVGKSTSGAERVAYSLGAVLLGLIVGGLLLDVVLPHVGVPRPLAQRPVLFAVDAMNIALMGWRIQRGAMGTAWRSSFRLLRRREWRVLTVSACCVPLVVAGANRLNNGDGDVVALVGLSFVAATFVLLLWWRDGLRDSVVATSTYLLGLSLLLATSLRGWYVSGHDIQQEFRVFELTKDRGVWSIGTLRDAYNACLSITILPTEISQMVRVDDPYVYKVFFQLLFAVCPVLVYLLARRYCSKEIAILSVVYFVGFPTFFTDMPYLNRQEIAFIFLGLAFLAMTRRHWTVWRRRAVLVVCALGIELSHYSTMYVFIGTLALVWIAENVYLLWVRLRGQIKRPRRSRAAGWADTARTVTLGVVLVAGLMAFVWGGTITRTAAGVTTLAKEVWPPVGGAHSEGVHYSLFSGSGQSSQQLLDQYRKQTLHDRKVDDPGTYLPLSEALSFPTRAVAAPSLPATRAGNLLSDLHVPVAALNNAVRDVASKGEQVFIGLGFLTVGFVGWRRRHMGLEYYFLGLGSVFMVVAVTMLPGLSVSYGVLRAFEQMLFFAAPFLVFGSFTVFRPLGRVWAARACAVLALVFMVSTIGVMPEVLGSYPAQLNLNNSGAYYDEYYVHPQEVEALRWLGGQPGTLPVGVQAENFVELYYFNGPKAITSQYITDIYPTLIRQSTWVLLGYATVRTGIATASVNNDLVTYRYPLGILSQNKDLVYNNGGTVIYK